MGNLEEKIKQFEVVDGDGKTHFLLIALRAFNCPQNKLKANEVFEV